MTSFVDRIRPAGKSRRIAYDMLCVLGGSLFLALMAQFSVHLWFTPVPITLQTLAVMLLGALLGSKRGALSVLVYLGEGALGLPVFAGGAAGAAILAGPTGGYLFSFIVSAFTMGFLLEKGWNKGYCLTLAAFAIGTALTLGLGSLWLCVFVGGKNALTMGVYPFLIGGVLKILVATALIPSGWKLLNFLKP
jgi:biotin transport system substrate-specific component